LPRHIFVTEYDSAWPSRFESERQALETVFAPILLSVHHIGSTSVPGLVAKPTIDILVVVSSIGDVLDYDPEMIELGYRPRGECLDAGGTAGRFYYCKEIDGVRSHHVHVCPSGHWQISELLAFPSYLRAHFDEARAYGELKRTALLDGDSDNSKYMASKAVWLRPRIEAAVREYSETE
jgi:GrpB-like predicted nucleotidyltransferase (UPF0157 family)